MKPVTCAISLSVLLPMPQAGGAAQLTPEAVEQAQDLAPEGEKAIGPAMIRLGVLLDRIGLSLDPAAWLRGRPQTP